MYIKQDKDSNHVIGYGYEYGAYEVNTYLVIKRNGNIFFKLYKYFDFNTQESIDEFIVLLEFYGYKPLQYWENKNSKKLIKK